MTTIHYHCGPGIVLLVTRQTILIFTTNDPTLPIESWRADMIPNPSSLTARYGSASGTITLAEEDPTTEQLRDVVRRLLLVPA